MKKIICSFVFIFSFFTASVAFGKIITADVAKTVATNFFQQNAGVSVNTISLAYTETSLSGEAVYYVFNINETGGFVIVVADDALYPVIGYSTEGVYVIPSSSSSAGTWMEQRKNEIITNKKQSIEATPEISSQWHMYLSNQYISPRINVVISPMVETLWYQLYPYNALCPDSSATGCVATTMAQIMRFWKYPAHGTGSSSYNCPNYGVLSADYGNTAYNWDNMPVGVVSSPDNAIDTLMYQCGVSVEMNYNPTGSDASVTIYDNPFNPNVCAQVSYYKYFNYNPLTIKGLQRSNYTDSAWINVIEADLNAGRPVQYAAFDPVNGGHTWVCDGYEANNFIHMNWGWNGAGNGYYSINKLTPDGYDFSNGHEVLTGIEPPAAPVDTTPSLYIYPDPASTTLTFEGPDSQPSIHYALYNLLGEQVQAGDAPTGGKRYFQTVQVSNLEPGMYFLRVSDSANSWTVKVEVK